MVSNAFIEDFITDRPKPRTKYDYIYLWLATLSDTLLSEEDKAFHSECP